VKEADSAPDSFYSRQADFQFKGRIIANGFENCTLFEDQSGCLPLIFDLPDKTHPKAGDVITATGILTFDAIGFRTVLAKSCVKERHDTPSEPQQTTVSQIVQGDGKPRFVSVRGVLVGANPDEVDSRFTQGFLYDDGNTLTFSLVPSVCSLEHLKRLANAEIRVSGICSSRVGGWRKFAPPSIWYVTDVTVVRPPPADPTDITPLGSLHGIFTSSRVFGSRRRADGHVLAQWMGNRFLLKTTEGALLHVLLANGQQPPGFRTPVTVAGLIDTDGVNLLMLDAILKQNDRLPSLADDNPIRLDIKEIFIDKKQQRVIQPALDGKTIQFSGTVIDIQKIGSSTRLLVKSGEFTIPVETSGSPTALHDISIGCHLSVTGIFLIELDRLQCNTVLPRLQNVLLVIRKPDDIAILAHSPWWTPTLLLWTIGGLLPVVIAIHSCVEPNSTNARRKEKPRTLPLGDHQSRIRAPNQRTHTTCRGIARQYGPKPHSHRLSHLSDTRHSFRTRAQGDRVS